VTGGNGRRRPPRPRIEIEAASATPEQAAAIAAALERFLVETAPAAQAREAVNPWQRAALREGVEGSSFESGGWGPAVGR
jgi:hypothetical protein